MIRAQLRHRLTHQYADGWKSLDQEIELGQVKLTPARVTRQGHGRFDGLSFVQHATVPRGVPAKQAIRALHNTLGGTHCRHEHDCCGCAIRSTDVKRTGRRTYLVHTNVHYNV